MKNNKKKKGFRSLILLLFLTIIMFGTSTYAWFTANRVVTINSLDVHVEASNGIQVSTDASSWKSVLTNADIKNGYTGHKNQVPATITAVSTDGTPTAQGRLNMYSSIIGNDATTGDYTIKTALETDTAGIDGKYIAFDLFVRVDAQQTIYFTPSTDIIKKGAEDKGLKNSARVAFVKLGHTTSSAGSAAMIALNDGTSSEVTVWEPNSDAHSDLVVSSVASDLGIALTEVIDGEGHGTGKYEQVSYRGISTTISDPEDLKAIVNGSKTTNDAGTVTYTKAVSPSIVTPEGRDNYIEFMELEAGVTKFRVYMWLEGQDIDCENGATGTDISFNIELSTTNGTN